MSDSEDEIVISRKRTSECSSSTSPVCSVGGNSTQIDYAITPHGKRLRELGKQEVVDAINGDHPNLIGLKRDGAPKSSPGANNFSVIDVKDLSDGHTYLTHYVMCKKCSYLISRKKSAHESRHRRTCEKRKGVVYNLPGSGVNHVSYVKKLKAKRGQYIDIESDKDATSTVNSNDLSARSPLRESPIKNAIIKLEEDVDTSGTVYRPLSVMEIEQNSVHFAKIAYCINNGTAAASIHLKNPSEPGCIQVNINILEDVLNIDGTVSWSPVTTPLTIIYHRPNQATSPISIFDNIAEQLKMHQEDIGPQHVTRMILLGDGARNSEIVGSEHMAEYVLSSLNIVEYVKKQIENPSAKMIFFVKTDGEKNVLQKVVSILEAADRIHRSKKGCEDEQNISSLQCLGKHYVSAEWLNDPVTPDDYLLSRNEQLIEVLCDLNTFIVPLYERYALGQKMLGDIVLDIFLLQAKFKTFARDGSSIVRRAVGIAGLHVVEECKGMFSPIHFAALRLTPERRQLSKVESFIPDIKVIADSTICDQWRLLEPLVDLGERRADMSQFFSKENNSGIDIELDQYLSFNDNLQLSVEKFWPYYRCRFPKLYFVARRIFSITNKRVDL